jgi:hypothetical protein
MELTEEQKERMRKNRERALGIQKRRREEQTKEASRAEEGSCTVPENGEASPKKKMWLDRAEEKPGAEPNPDSKSEVAEEALELEEFEVGASKWVTKKEAMKVYLLPAGTLTICKYTEKPNPHHKSWLPMKLYDRSEVRRFSRERFGGLAALIEERKKRQDKRFQKDLDETKDLFSK